LVVNSHIFKHELGWIGISFSDIGLSKIILPTQTLDECMSQMQTASMPQKNTTDLNVEGFVDEFDKYLSGIPTSFNEIKIDLSDSLSTFIKTALMKCKEIPYGQTQSYGDIAEKIGNPKSSRAVGLAMARNPLPIIIPCHRVVRSDGGLGGYGGKYSNPSIKQLFLDIEKSHPVENQK